MNIRIMSFKIFTVFILCIFLSYSCNDLEKEIFNHDKVSFILPKDWKVDKIDSTDKDFFYMCIDKKGHGASADAIIEWNNGSFNLDTVLQSRQIEYLQEDIFKKGNITFSNVKEDSFGKYEALVTTFNFKYLEDEHVGKLHCFYVPECDKTMMVAFHQESDDEEKQKKDFETIEKSLNCIEINDEDK
jgi:hypothetical protein